MSSSQFNNKPKKSSDGINENITDENVLNNTNNINNDIQKDDYNKDNNTLNNNEDNNIEDDNNTEYDNNELDNNMVDNNIPNKDLDNEYPDTNPLELILNQFIKDAFSQNNIPTNNIPTNNIPTNNIPTNNIPTNNIPTNNIPTNNIPTNNTMFPISFDLVIENYDSNGKKETKIISSSNDKIYYSNKNIDELINTDKNNINKIIKSEKDSMDKDSMDKDTVGKDTLDKDTLDKDSEKTKIDKDELKYNKIKKTKEPIKTKQIKILKEVDYASSIGDLKFLENWVQSPIIDDSYSSESIDNASANGKIDVLNWWKTANKKYGLELKYTEKSINLASKYDRIDSLNWWINSELELKYNHNAIDWASSQGKIRILDWWLSKSKDKLVQFEYTSNSIDNAKMEEKQLFKLIKWWVNTNKSNLDIKFKYTRDFIDYLESWNYKNIYEFLVENKMISNDEKFNPPVTKSPNDSQIFKILEFMGIPIGIGSGSEPSSYPGSSSGSRLGADFILGGKKQSKTTSKYDFDSLPEDIQNHIKEKEEELSNNMMINGKAKEYIDNLVKIPFGKYKFEKIFCFVKDLVNKINSINSSSSNDFMKTYKLTNESDLIKFFDSVKFYPDNTYLKYQKLYSQFIDIRKNYMSYVNGVLDECVYGHNSTKKQIKCIISQWLSGGFKLGVVIGIQGPPGVGKTTMIKGALSKCLIDFVDYDLENEMPYITQQDENTIKNSKSRPFCFTSLGGTTNGSTLSGHNITYHGATSGDIVKNLKNANIMNPILYFDELDKISNTEHGHEISSVLTHITDPAQNSHFTDRYFAEVKIDLSKAIIVFSYNDTKKIDRILLDRIQEIRLNPIKSKEKLVICRKFIIPEVCSQLGYNPDDVNISDVELNSIINEYTMEAGVRKLKEKLFEVFRIRHLEVIENPNSKLNNTISSKFISDTFGDYPKITHKKIKSSNIIGCINGLYASASGLGGITPIQVKQIYSKDLMGINITGSVEKVMEESVKVAKTVAWNLLTREQQDTVIKEWDSRGFHVHFPDGSTPKDGPSGGTAITCALYSLLIGCPIKNNVAITGEIDLDGNVTEIGGLDAKLNGAKKAGIKLALIPKENHREFEIVKKNNPELIDKNFKVYEISHVNDALKHIF